MARTAVVAVRDAGDREAGETERRRAKATAPRKQPPNGTVAGVAGHRIGDALPLVGSNAMPSSEAPGPIESLVRRSMEGERRRRRTRARSRLVRQTRTTDSYDRLAHRSVALWVGSS